jgi:hypothetical protein
MKTAQVTTRTGCGGARKAAGLIGFRVSLMTATMRVLLLAGLALSAPSCDKSEASASQKSAAPAPAPIPAGRCGDKGLPDCPTQGWMKATLQPFLLSGDSARLADALARLAAAAPAGYDNWAAIAEAGAKAARAGDLARAKESCAECHSRHRARFRAELRQRPLL